MISYGAELRRLAGRRGRHRARTAWSSRVYYWDPVIAPSGMAFYTGELFPDWQGDLLIGALNPGALVRLELDARATGAWSARSGC